MPKNQFSDIAKQAAELTNKELATEVAKVSQISHQRFAELLPLKKDKEAFVQLMAQVEADTAMDTKLANLVDNIKTVGPVIFKILKVLV